MVATVGSIAIDLIVKSAAFEAAFRMAGSTVDRESARMAKSAGIAERSFNSLAATAARFGGVLGGAFAGREIVRYADAWTEAGNKIAAAGQIAGRQARGLRELNDIATETRSGLTETVDLYAKLLRATGNVAKSEEEVARATEIVNKAFKAGGAAASEQAAGILQLSQALGSGVLQGDELRSLRENAPLIAQAIANEFGTTIAGLKELGAEGKLTSERVFKAILAGQKDIEAAFAQTAPTIADGVDLIKNAGIELIGTLSEVTGGAGSLSGELARFGKEMQQTADRINKFAQNPSLKNFFENLLGVKVTTFGAEEVDRFRTAIEAARNPVEDLRAKIAETEETIKRLEEAGALGPFRQHLENAKADLAAMNEQLRISEVLSHGAFASLARSAEDASMKALAAFQAVTDGLKKIPDKTITINVRTVQTPSGPVGVTSLGGVTMPSISNPLPSNPSVSGTTGSGSGSSRIDPLDPTGTFQPPATSITPPPRIGRFAAGGTVRAGEIALVGEEGPELVQFSSAASVTQASSTAGILSGGQSVLSMIEQNTYEGLLETRRALGYLDTLVKDEQATLRAIQALQGDIRDVGRSASAGGSFAPGGAPVGRWMSTGFGGSSATMFDTAGLYQSYAKGGIAFEPSIFGEAGPEAAVPLPDGRSIPVTIDGAVGNIAVHYHAAAGNPDPSRQSMMELQDRIRSTVRDVMGGL